MTTDRPHRPRALTARSAPRAALVVVAILAMVAWVGVLPADAAGSSVISTTTVPVDSEPWGVAITPDGSTALVANSYSNSVSVLARSGTTWTDTGTVAVGAYPIGIAIAPDGQTALVTNNGGNSVTVLGRVGSSWYPLGDPVPAGDHPIDVAIAPDGQSALVTNNHDGTVSVLTRNGGTWIESGTLDVHTDPIGVAITPDGTSALVVDHDSNAVTVLAKSGSTWTSTGNMVSVGEQPWAVAITPDGTSALVTDNGDGTVTALARSGSSWGVTGSTTSVGAQPMAVAIMPDGQSALVVDNDDQAAKGSVVTLTKSGTSWGTTGSPVAVGNNPSGVAITPDGASALVTNWGDNTVSTLQWAPALSPASQTVQATVGKAVQTQPLSATGMAGTVSFHLDSGQTLPAGLSFDSATGVISGTPTTAQAQTVYTVTGTDGTTTQTGTIELAVDITFADVPAGVQFHDEIQWLGDQGIATGWPQPDGTRLYQPLASIHRDAMAAYLYRLAGSPSYTPPTTSPFTDVHPGDAYYKEMTWLATQKISTGWADGTYRPLDPVARDAMAAFLYRLINR